MDVISFSLTSTQVHCRPPAKIIYDRKITCPCSTTRSACLTPRAQFPTANCLNIIQTVLVSEACYFVLITTKLLRRRKGILYQSAMLSPCVTALFAFILPTPSLNFACVQKFWRKILGHWNLPPRRRIKSLHAWGRYANNFFPIGDKMASHEGDSMPTMRNAPMLHTGSKTRGSSPHCLGTIPISYQLAKKMVYRINHRSAKSLNLTQPLEPPNSDLAIKLKFA